MISHQDLLELAKQERDREQYAYHQTGKMFSGTDVAEAPLYGMLAKVWCELACDAELESTLNNFDADWRQYAKENNAKVEAAPKLKRGPRSGQSCIEHHWVSPEMAKTKSIHVRQMLKIMTGERMSDKTKREKKKARLVSSRRMADASQGKVSKAYRLPSGRKIMQIEGDKSYTFDVVCFKAGKGNPGADEGEDAAGSPYSAHGGVGPNNDRYCCTLNTRQFDKPCPICTARSDRIKSGVDFKTDELVKKWRASDRTLFNVWDHAAKGEKCQLLDISNFAFAQMLYKTVDENTDKYEYWGSPGIEGFTIKASFEKKKIGTGDFPNCWKIDFIPRSEPIPDDILDSAMPLDEMLICPDFDKLQSAFEQGTTEGDDPAKVKEAVRAAQPTLPSRTVKADADEDDEGPEQEFEAGDWVKYKGKPWEVISIRDGMINLEAETGGEIKRGVDPEDCALTDKPKTIPQHAAANNGKTTSPKEAITALASRKKPIKAEEEE